MRINKEFIDRFVSGILKPGAVIVSYGMRGGGKTHCAVSFCQRMIDHEYPSAPKHVVLITNVIFVKRTESGFVTESPPGVHTIHSMKEIFPIVVDALERYSRKDAMVILLLDEAQNFLLGDMNNVGDMASSMKKFCGIIRKFNLCLWLLSPAMRNLGPAFRNFLDADTDPGNVNCTFQKDNARAKRIIEKHKLELDPRSLVFVKPGMNAGERYLPVPTSSWTRDPDTLEVGEYAYDNLSSADFTVGDFPFHEFVQYISGKSSYDMISGIKEFYEMLENRPEDAGADPELVQKVKSEVSRSIAVRLRNEKGMSRADVAELFGVSENTITNWTNAAKKNGGS